jgi:uncharacterized protein (UPF0333 family)
MVRDTKKGQSILEYTLVVGAVIAVLIIVLLGGPSKNANVKNKIYRTYTKTANAINATEKDIDKQGIFANATAEDLP